MKIRVKEACEPYKDDKYGMLDFCLLSKEEKNNIESIHVNVDYVDGGVNSRSAYVSL